MPQYFPVLLIHSFFPQPKIVEGQFSQASHPPLGIAYLSAYLKQKGVEVHCLDLNMDAETHVFDWIARNPVGVVGLSINAATFPNAWQLARKIRLQAPLQRIVFGGLAVSMFYEYLSRGSVDFYVVGDGEETFFELVSGLSVGKHDFSDTTGLAFSKEGQLMVTPSRVFSQSLDELPFPDRAAFDLKRYVSFLSNQAYVTTSRSCPFVCSFCIRGNMKLPYRVRTIDNVMREISHIRQYYPFYERIHFVDETLNANPTRFKNLCVALGKEAVKWSCNCRAETWMDLSVLQLMKTSGCQLVEIGIESGVQQVLDHANKGTKISSIQQFLQAAKDAGLVVIGTVMVPHLTDTPETLEQSVAVLTRWSKDYPLMVFPLQTMVYPGSPYEKDGKRQGVVVNNAMQVDRTRTVSAVDIMETLRQLQILQRQSYMKNASYFTALVGNLPTGANLDKLMDVAKRFMKNNNSIF